MRQMLTLQARYLQRDVQSHRFWILTTMAAIQRARHMGAECENPEIANLTLFGLGLLGLGAARRRRKQAA